MSTRIEMRQSLVGHDSAVRHGGHDHFVRDLEARRRQAEAIVDSVHWVWTSARRALKRLMDQGSRGRTPAANDNRARGALSSADATGPSPVRRISRSILAFYASWRRRSAAIDELRALDDRVLADIGLRREQIELAVDGLLPRRGESVRRPVGRDLPANRFREELALAA